MLQSKKIKFNQNNTYWATFQVLTLTVPIEKQQRLGRGSKMPSITRGLFCNLYQSQMKEAHEQACAEVV